MTICNVIAGQATATLELLEDAGTDLDAIVDSGRRRRLDRRRRARGRAFGSKAEVIGVESRVLSGALRRDARRSHDRRRHDDRRRHRGRKGRAVTALDRARRGARRAARFRTGARGRDRLFARRREAGRRRRRRGRRRGDCAATSNASAANASARCCAAGTSISACWRRSSCARACAPAASCRFAC